MRVLCGAVLAAVLACGTSTTGNGNTGQTTPAAGGTPADAGTSGVAPPQTFAVALGVAGNGEIDGLGDPCTGTCIRQVHQGAIELHAVAAQGFNFDHWSTACAGNVCSVAITSDMSVTATFVPQPVQLPPPAVLRKLTVAVTGDGRVTSTPAGIDCPGTCSMSFADGTHVALSAAPGSGMLFSGFSGACTGTACLLTLGADANVSAAFAVDDCIPLMPARLTPALVPDINCNGGCTGGTSDAGTGNFMLHFFTVAGTLDDGFDFFSLVNGGLHGTTSWFFGAGAQFRTFSEPSGFTFTEQAPGANWFDVWTVDALGNAEGQTFLSNANTAKPLVASDPSGGYVMVSSVPQSAGFTETTWQRFSSVGLVQSSPLAIASEQVNSQTAAAGVTLSGATLIETHVLNLAGVAGAVERQWVDKNGVPLTGTFTIPDQPTVHSYQFLLDGGLLERDGNAAFTRIWNEGSTQPTPLPSWLSTRSAASWLTSIRAGAGYAMAGTCNGVEVLAKSGRSCGCLAVPGLGPTSSIGRDGSLIVPRTDHYEIYPLLFH